MLNEKIMQRHPADNHESQAIQLVFNEIKLDAKNLVKLAAIPVLSLFTNFPSNA